MTPQERFREAQRAAMPQQDLSQFQGLWVALREGHVVSSNVDAIALRDDAAVRPDDMLMPVPMDSGDSILIA